MLRLISRLGSSFGLLALLAAPVAAQRPDGLHLEAGVHLQRVENLFADRAHGRLISTSTDGTMRIWDAGTGSLQRTDMLILPASGAIQKAGLSRDGEMLAIGLTEGREFLCLYDVGRGRATHIREVADRVTAVSFAWDGMTVAVATGRWVGIYTVPGLEVVSEHRFEDVVWALDYDDAGRLAAGSFAGEVRLYDAVGRRLAEGHTTAGDEITDLRFSPDGTMLAAGFNSGSGSEILDVQGLASLAVLSPPRAVRAFNEYARVAWTPDGDFLLTSASVQGAANTERFSAVFAWRLTGPGNNPSMLDSRQESLLNLVAVDGVQGPEAAMAFWDGEVRRVRDGLVQWRTPMAKQPFERTDPLGLMASADGSVVGFRGAGPTRPFRLDLVAGRLSGEHGDGTELHGPVHAAAGLEVTAPSDSQAIRIGGQHPALDRWEFVTAWALDPAGRGVVLASRFAIRRFDAAGAAVWVAEAGTEAWAVTVSLDGRFVIGAMGDGTLRWFDAGTGAPVLSAFVHANGEDWIAWTPDGRFTGPARSQRLLQPFQAGRLPMAMPVAFDAVAFRQGFETPGLALDVFGHR